MSFTSSQRQRMVSKVGTTDLIWPQANKLTFIMKLRGTAPRKSISIGVKGKENSYGLIFDKRLLVDGTKKKSTVDIGKIEREMEIVIM